jgi:hypothetical protein
LGNRLSVGERVGFRAAGLKTAEHSAFWAAICCRCTAKLYLPQANEFRKEANNSAINESLKSGKRFSGPMHYTPFSPMEWSHYPLLNAGTTHCWQVPCTSGGYGKRRQWLLT